jgi:hypothetical protein
VQHEPQLLNSGVRVVLDQRSQLRQAEDHAVRA